MTGGLLELMPHPEPESLVPRDSTTGILDVENRHDLLIHADEPRQWLPQLP